MGEIVSVKPSISETSELKKPIRNYAHWKGTPEHPVTRYRKAGGKQEIPYTPEEFAKGIEKTKKDSHRAFMVLVNYSAVRRQEALRPLREAFTIKDKTLYFQPGPRLKKQKHRRVCPYCQTRNKKDAPICRLCKRDISTVTPELFGKPKTTKPVKLPLSLPFMDLLLEQVKNTPPNKHVFNFSGMTAWRIFDRAGLSYPHYGRLTRITTWLDKGIPTIKVRAMTGLTLAALEAYAGDVSTEEIENADK